MNNLKEPIRIIAYGQEYSVGGIIYPDDTVKINRGSLISRKCTTTIKLEKNFQLRDRIISTRVDSNYRLKYDEIFPNRTVAAIIVSGSERNGNDFFKTVKATRNWVALIVIWRS